MAVRSKRLFGPVVVGTNVVTVYTCPAGETALLKFFTAGVGGIGGTNVQLFINGTGAANRVWQSPITNGEAIHERDLFIVLHPTDTLRAAASSGSLTISGHGAELEGTAD